MRQKAIERAEEKQTSLPINELAKQLHPEIQFLVLSRITDLKSGYRELIFKPDIILGTKKLAYFRAGQYLTFNMDINGTATTRSFPIASTPIDAISGFYKIIIKRNTYDSGINYIFKKWTEGMKITAYSPSGTFYYNSLRDYKTVAGIAFGSGIIPFMSMAKAIAEGTEDFNLTLFYESDRAKNLVFRQFFDNIAAKTKKVKVYYLLENENSPGCYRGIITKEFVDEKTEGGYSLFASGGFAFHEFIGKMYYSFPNKLYRKFDLIPIESVIKHKNYPKIYIKNEFDIQIRSNSGVKIIKCERTETILSALERNDVEVPSRCRNGKCGYCHTKILAGQVFIPYDEDGRRHADLRFGYIHPCCSYPLSDLILFINNLNQ